jgi:DUF2911 family protein
MKSLFAKLILLIAVFSMASIATAQVDLPRVSPNATVSQMIGITDVKITYSRPGVKGRVIWGQLVPYDKVWRTGANEATTITFSTDVKVEGQSLPAGKYALMTIPGQTEWTIIFNKNADQFGAFDYKQESDVLRVKVKPGETPHQEWMEFSVENLAVDSADVVLRWEKLQVQFKVQVDTMSKVVASCSSAISSLKPDDYRTPSNCAQFLVTNKGDLNQALQWIDKSISVKERFGNLSAKARIQAAMGKKAEAITTAKKALTMTQDVAEEDIDALKKQMQEWQ